MIKPLEIVMESFNSFQVLENISLALCLVSPENNLPGSPSCDFKIDFLNDAFKAACHSLVKKDDSLSLLDEKLGFENKALLLAKSVFEKKENLQKESYSLSLKTFFKIKVDFINDGCLCLCLEDISAFKESESELKRQSLRLENLSQELNLNKSDLKKKNTSIEMLNSQLRSAAYHDPLTNLNNRFLYNSHVMEAARLCKEDNSKFAIFLFDVDNIKMINDSKGANAGDQILQTIAQELRKLENENTSAYRMNGDEFILLSKKIKDTAAFKKLAEDFKDRLFKKEIFISGGIAFYPDDTSNASDIHTFADMAKSEAKRSSRNSILAFEQVMQEKFISKVNLERKMAKAMEEGLFQLYFQPQFDVSTNELRGFESLIRWHDQELGWISPEEFIPLAEETNLVIPIGDWVMMKGLETLEEWETKYNFTGILSINVSPVQFSKEDFLLKFTNEFNRHKINPAHLELEVTEGILINDVDSAIKKLTEIKNMGVGISLDDFGTGYSSLRYLQILPLTTLKIDKSFIANIASKTGTETHITESIVSMVSKMGLDTIAEGVETEEQLDILKQINCRNIQGFLKGKPMPKDLCEKLLSGDISAVLSLEKYKKIFVKGGKS